MLSVCVCGLGRVDWGSCMDCEMDELSCVEPGHYEAC